MYIVNYKVSRLKMYLGIRTRIRRRIIRGGDGSAVQKMTSRISLTDFPHQTHGGKVTYS